MYFSNKHDFEKIRSNKIISFLLCFLIIIMLVSLITIPKIIKKKSNSTYKIIKVLEIEPGKLSRLNNGYVQNGYKLEVTAVDMPTFISTISTITGDYDVVYIGRYNTNLKQEWNTDYIYRDYTAPFSQEWGPSLKGNYGDTDPDKDKNKYRDVTQSVWYGSLGLYEKQDFDKLRYAAKSGHITSTINGQTKTFSEYYPENDITNRKAKQILNMINSNQLVYIDTSILTDSSLSTTKLVKNFSSCNKDNFKKVNSLSSSQLISDYSTLESKYKRPDVTLVNSPIGDTKEEESSITNKSDLLKNRLNNRSLKFTFTLNNNSKTEYKAKLYLDYNEDGIFEGDGSGNSENDECVGYLDNVSTGTNIITYKLSSSFVGYLNWKIEICNTSNEYVCSNLYGSAVFKSLTGEKQVIKVLQLSPTCGSNIDLSATNNLFYKYKKDLDDYDIQVTPVNMSEFNAMDADTVLKDYNMIIVGFIDGFGNGDNITISDNGLKILKEFNDHNKSIMLSHDTIGLSILGSSNITGNNKNYQMSRTNSNYKLAQEFKDAAGQCWYSSNPFADNSNDSSHSSFINNKSTLGATAYSSLKLYFDYAQTTSIKKINSSQITSYPYKLCESTDSLNVAKTHCQWYQINLENENLVPWFNLSTSTINSGDSRNFYYIYSLKNITYTSSGNTGDYTDDEMKLFVNTIIKSIMGANKKPEVTNKIYEDQSNLIDPVEIDDNGDAGTITEDNNYNFAVNIYDMDAANNEDMKLNAVIVPSSVDNDSAFSYADKFELCRDKDVLYKHNGIDTNLTIPNSYLAQNIGNKLKIVVQAKDGTGECSDIKSFNLTVDTKTKVYHGVFNSDNEKNNNGKWSEDLIDSYINSASQLENYYTVVPFASLIHVYNANINIKLTIDPLFSIQGDGVNAAYSNEEFLPPSIYYVNNDGTLTSLATLTNTHTNIYEYSLTNSDLSKISSNGLLENGFCNLVIKYYGKTYKKPDDDNPLYYLNTVEVFKNDRDLGYGNANIYVGNKELKGNLF